MSVVFKDLQEWTASAGVNGETHKLNLYDSATGAQVTVTSASLNSLHSDLQGGNLTIAVVGGRAVETINASGLTGSTTPRWWTATVNGITIGTGGDIYVVTRVTETITAPCTLTQDYPSSGATTDLHITGTGTVTCAGHKIDFSALYGAITVDAGIKISGAGSASVATIKAIAVGDGHIVLGDGVEFDACGTAINFQSNTYWDGYVTCGKIHAKSNSLVTIDPALANCVAQIMHKGGSNENYPSTYAEGMVIERSFMALDSAQGVHIAGVFAGLRCGVHLLSACLYLTWGNQYSHCTQSSLSDADVANFELTNNTIDTTGLKMILRGGEWTIHSPGNSSVIDGVILSECNSHYYLGFTGTSTTARKCLFLPGDPGGTANLAGKIGIYSSGDIVDHCTFAGVVGDTYIASPVSILDSVTDATVTNNIFYKAQIDRGPSITGDPVISPMTSGDAPQSVTGLPPRPSANANRLTTGDYNGFFGNASVGGDTVSTYGVGQGSGTPGAHDVTTDPTFSGGSGAFSWGTWEADLIAGTKTITQLHDAITAFYTPTNPDYHGTASDGGDIGAVPFVEVIVPGGSALHRRSRYFNRLNRLSSRI